MEHVKMVRMKSQSSEEPPSTMHSSAEGIFSRWVFPVVANSLMETATFTLDHDTSEDEEDAHKNDIEMWLHYKKASTRKGKLKKLVRQKVPSGVRKRLWQEASGGCDFMSKSPELYHELCEKLFGKDNAIPTEVPSCPLVIDTEFMSYYLNGNGVLVLRKLLYVLSYLHPDVTYSPLLQCMAAVLLHFMEEVWCFACLSAMLTSKANYFDQSEGEAAISAAGFQECVRINMRQVFKRLSSFIIEKDQDSTKHIVFPLWQKMIFDHVEFTVLVRIIDCFIVEGQKVLYRSAMMLLKIFYDYSLAYEKIGCPTPNDLCLAIGQHAEILSVNPDDFIKASLKIKLRRKDINRAREQHSCDAKAIEEDTGRDKAGSMVLGVDLHHLSDLLTTQQWRKLISWLPVRIQLMQPHLVFSTDKDGYNLKTLYVKAEEEEQTIIIIKNDKNEIFGAYLSESLERRNDGRKNLTYFGTGETFLFTILPNTLPFKWVGIDSTMVDGPTKESMRRNVSFVLIEYQPGSKDHPRRRPSIRRAVRKFSRGSYKIPRDFSSKDFKDNDQSYGGIPKNHSLVNLKEMPDVFDVSHDHTDQQTIEEAEEEVEGTQNGDVLHVGNDGSSEMLTMKYRKITIDETDHPDTSEPNDMFIACDDECFIVGGGGGHGLWIDKNLDHGRTEVCNTFKNHLLTANESGDFKCTRVEVFGFQR